MSRLPGGPATPSMRRACSRRRRSPDAAHPWQPGPSPHTEGLRRSRVITNQTSCDYTEALLQAGAQFTGVALRAISAADLRAVLFDEACRAGLRPDLI